MNCIVKDVIIPTALSTHQRVANEIQQARCKLGDPPLSPTMLQREAEKLRILLTVDGEYQQLSALIEYFSQSSEVLGPAKAIELIKFSASCSKTMQPADVSKSFMVFKSVAKKLTFSKVVDEPVYMQKVREVILSPLAAASRRTYAQFLAHAPAFLSTAFTIPIVTAGWQRAGLHPFDAEILLSQCTSWTHLKEVQSKAAIAAIPKLMGIAISRGEMTDIDLQAAVGDVFDLSVSQLPQSTESISNTRQKAKSKKPLEKRPLNHRRAIHLTHAKILQIDEDISRMAAENDTRVATQVTQ